MFDCLGIAVLGLCAYDPSNPPNIYFSIGEAMAALSITLIIPQFLRPIYRFRLASQFIRVSHIYLLVFLGAACVLAATAIANVGLPRGLIFAYPVFWEFIGGILFLFAFAALAFAFLWPARARRGSFPRFAQGAADFLAHADQRDQSAFSRDLLQNIQELIGAARFIEIHRDRTAFLEFRYRREIEDARYAWSLLRLVADPQFCATLVHYCPWDTAVMLHRISNRKLVSRAAENLVQEIGRQAIICPSSMMGREIGYKGFSAAPVLSQALFDDAFINRHYRPLSGIQFADLKGVDRDTIDRLMHGLESTLATVLDTGHYWDDRSLMNMENCLQAATFDVNAQVRSGRGDHLLVSSINIGMKSIIQTTRNHLETLDPNTYSKLYASIDRKWPTTLDHVCESIMGVLSSFARDFEGYDDAFWSTATCIMNGVFNRFGEPPDGMDPLQERVAKKFTCVVKENMDGYYPPLTRILLSVIGAYDEPGNTNPNSAFSLLRQAFYAKLMRFPALNETDSDKAKQYLPNDVRYDPEKVAFVKIYRLGEERLTELRALSIEPVPFEAVRRNAGR